jgi:N6-L-threonylcarbamoyladenine synthase
MKILGIETSCDETAVCVLEAERGPAKPVFKVLGNALYSQVKTHAEYGGVFPSLAKREHAKNLVPLFKKSLQESDLLKKNSKPTGSFEETPWPSVKKILEREPELFEALKKLVQEIQKPDIDLIAVTNGPGLEPALWVGINFAMALREIWNIPVMPTNHMEGHIASVLLKTGNKQLTTDNKKISSGFVEFPALALLISGGHTQLVLAKDWLEYEILGETRDDAVGEAFDKVARILGLSYPGGPEISKLAKEARQKKLVGQDGKHQTGASRPIPNEPDSKIKLPRPMLKSDDYDFSFSGLKTAVLYAVKKIPELTSAIKAEIAEEFENAVTEVLLAKTKKALGTKTPEAIGIKTLILGGGVTANAFIRESFQKMVQKEFPGTKLLIPTIDLSTDNAVMIAMAGYLNFAAGKKPATEAFKAEGNLRL